MITKYSRKSDNHKALSEMYAARHWMSDYGRSLNYIKIRDNKVLTLAARKNKYLDEVIHTLLKWIDMEIKDLEERIEND